MDDLIAFLRTRLDEREARARQLAKDWDELEVPREGHDPGECDECDRARKKFYNTLDHDSPEFVLAEVDVKRRIIDMWDPNVLAGSYFDALAEVLCLLALPYAGHLDYREEWRPDTPPNAT